MSLDATPSPPPHMHAALSIKSGDGRRGVRPGVKDSFSPGAHLWSPLSIAKLQSGTEYQKSTPKKHNIAANMPDW